MIVETYQFICKYCDKGYRGLVKTCPNCGAILRGQKLVTEVTEETVEYTLSYPKDSDLDVVIKPNYILGR